MEATLKACQEKLCAKDQKALENKTKKHQAKMRKLIADAINQKIDKETYKREVKKLLLMPSSWKESANLFNCSAAKCTKETHDVLKMAVKDMEQECRKMKIHECEDLLRKVKPVIAKKEMTQAEYKLVKDGAAQLTAIIMTQLIERKA
jgi:hypothetical protein